MPQRMTARAFTADRGPPELMLSSLQIGPKRRILPNGSLLCEDVPIARTGWMLYGAGEIPLAADPSSRAIYVERTAEELFRPETIGSFMACAIIDAHRDIGPHNWKDHAGGFTTTNVRRGEGENSDCLVADIIISRKDLIDAVQAGKREVSCGYDADYEQVSPGVGRQLNIVGNHIALVDKGRCGPRCAIGDRSPLNHHHQEEIETMPQANGQRGSHPKRRYVDVSTLEGIQKAARQLLEAGSGDDDDGGEEAGAVHVHVHTGDAAGGASGRDADDDPDCDPRLKALEKQVADLTGAVGKIGESIKAFVSSRSKTGDAADGDDPGAAGSGCAALADSYKDLQGKCEILVPGFRMPTFDAALTRAFTVDRMCAQRRRVLDLFGASPAGAAILVAVTGDKEPDIAGMDCKAAALVFNAAVAARASENQRAATGDGRMAQKTEAAAQALPTIQSQEEANRKFWNSQSAAAAQA